MEKSKVMILQSLKLGGFLLLAKTRWAVFSIGTSDSWWEKEIRVRFWKDFWLGDTPLKESFPRLFRMSGNVDALVQDYFKQVDGRGSWHFDFRRSLRSFEVDSLNSLLTLLREFPLLLSEKDEMIWYGDSSGNFSVKAVLHLIQSQLSTVGLITNSDWVGAAPPRVQIFGWCVLKEKILARVELRRRGLLRLEDDSNVFFVILRSRILIIFL